MAETMTALGALRTIGSLYASATGNDAAKLEELDSFVRALAAREEQVRREALVEGARWALGQARDVADEAREAIDEIDPAAILESEKGTKP